MRHHPHASRLHLIASLSAAALLGSLAIACDDGTDYDARFASASDTQIRTAVETGAGLPAAYAALAVFAAEIDHATSEGACPQRQQQGDTVTLSADGCVAPSGTSYSGRVIAKNSPYSGGLVALFGESTAIPDQPMSLEFESFRIASEEGTQEIDGSVWQSHAEPEDGQSYTASVDLALTVDGDRIETSADMACDETGSCSIEAGANGYVGGLGSFAIAGWYQTTEGGEIGWLELSGADTLRIEFGPEDDDCVPYTIDGEPAGQICFEAGEQGHEGGEGQEQALEAVGSAIGCGDGTFDLYGWVKGEATSVTMTLAANGREETHELSLVSYDEDLEEYEWAVVVVEGDAYIPGQSTLFRCGELDLSEIDRTVTAVDGDGNVSTYP